MLSTILDICQTAGVIFALWFYYKQSISIASQVSLMTEQTELMANQVKLSTEQIELSRKQSELNYKLQTLEYVTSQFDRLEDMGARLEMRKCYKSGANSIKEYIDKLPSDDQETKKQLFLEYVYTFNRIAAGIFNESLNKEVIIKELWTISFFANHWKKFESFIQDERNRNNNQSLYKSFQNLANENSQSANR